MGLLLLLACGSFSTPYGEERVRGALWIDGAISNVAGALVVVANSPVRCEAEEVADNPATSTDEAASAGAWWQAELQAAVTREGASLFAMWLGGDASAGGAFELVDQGWLRDVPAQGGAVSLQVHEAAAPERDGAVYLDQPTDYVVATGMEGTASAEVRDSEADVTFAAEGWSGTVTAARCENPELANLVTASLLELLLLQ